MTASQTNEAAPHTSGKRARAAHLGPERRRPMILDAALSVFLEHGYEGSSMDAIADRAGVTKPVVYACYPSKEELFTALLEREEQRIMGKIAAALPAAAGEDIERTFAGGLTAFLRAVAESPDVFRILLLGEGGGNAAIAERVRRGRAAQVDAIAMLARAWLAQRGATEPETTGRLIAYAIAGAAEGAARAVLDEPERFDPDVMGPTLARFIARGQRAL